MKMYLRMFFVCLCLVFKVFFSILFVHVSPNFCVFAGPHRPVKIVGLVGCRVLVVCGHTAASYQPSLARARVHCGY